MILPKNIKRQPKWWKFIPISRFGGNAIYPNIYLADPIYNDLISQDPKNEWIAFMIHEQKHIERMKEVGPFVFNFKYILSPKFRYQEELIATRVEFQYLKTKGETFDFRSQAKSFSSYKYFWMVSSQKCEEDLKGLWEIV
jgi:hypothetical protein